ncbi:MAG: divergent polysaccharide deacetylase family protein [Magnetococcales bacterium]|nr:divergent polysaccharide deacetylase family protein [Magnetococcales bacterium]
MAKLTIRSGWSLLGGLVICVVLFLVGWGVAQWIETRSDQPSTGESGQVLPATNPSAPPVGGVDAKALRLTLAETMRVPKPSVPLEKPLAPTEGPLTQTGRPPPQTAEPRPPVGKPSTLGEGSVPSGGVRTQAEKSPARTEDKYAPLDEPAVANSLLYEESLPEAGKSAPVPQHLLPPIAHQEKKTKATHTLALIIDDLGYEWSISRAIVALPADITLALLPRVPYARDIAKLGRAAGRELLLHQPMEPQRYPQTNPGPGAILSHMDKAEIQAVLQANLDRFPEVVGVNNHMGSRLTENADAMDAVMAVLLERQLFFIDSRTSETSVGAERAMLGQVPTAARDVFIDNVPNEEAILHQLAQLEHLAHKQGEAIGIGHPYRATLAALHRWLPTLPQKGIQLLRVSQLIRPLSARNHYPNHLPVANANGVATPPANPLPHPPAGSGSDHSDRQSADPDAPLAEGAVNTLNVSQSIHTPEE